MIDRVIIFCSPNDESLTELCVASIRYWNSTVPLFLHKDESRGRFDTKKIENHFNVQLCDSSKSSNGNPLSKLLYITKGADLHKHGNRILLLDSDTMFFGDLISRLNDLQGDIAVTGVENPRIGFLESHYFTLDFSRKNAPSELKPSFVFNTGHVLFSAGTFQYEDFEPFLIKNEFGQSQVIDGIKLYDQGLLNFVVNKQLADGELKLHSHNLFLWSKGSKNFIREEHEPFLIHWAGTTHPLEERMEHWKHFRRYRLFFLRETEQGIVIYIVKRIAAIFIHYLRQVRLFILGKRKFMRL